MARKEVAAGTPLETWWHITPWASVPEKMIQPVRVVRETENYVILAQSWIGRLWEQKADKGRYFKSYTQAREHMIEVAEDERAEARTAMNTAEAMVQRAHSTPKEAPHVAW